MIAILAATEESCTQTTYRHVFQFQQALEEQNPDDPTVLGVLDTAREDVVQFLGEQTLRTALVDPADVAVRLTRLNPPSSALLHPVWYNDHPDLSQLRIIPLLTVDQVAGTVEVYTDATGLPGDCISLRARLTSTAPLDVSPAPITDDMLKLKLQLLHYLSIANLARHAPATADDTFPPPRHHREN